MNRAEQDAFSGGVCVALSVVYAQTGVCTLYEEIVATCDEAKLESWARKNRDMELPHIRKARRRLRDRRERQALSTGDKA